MEIILQKYRNKVKLNLREWGCFILFYDHFKATVIVVQVGIIFLLLKTIYDYSNNNLTSYNYTFTIAIY